LTEANADELFNKAYPWHDPDFDEQEMLREWKIFKDNVWEDIIEAEDDEDENEAAQIHLTSPMDADDLWGSANLSEVSINQFACKRGWNW
jgi:hypothetical protein